MNTYIKKVTEKSPKDHSEWHLCFWIVSDVSSLVFNLEDNLPDDLISNNSWGDNIGANKPTIQLAGPPGNNQQQINGDDSIGVPNVALQRQHQRPTGTFIAFQFFLGEIVWLHFKKINF